MVVGKLLFETGKYAVQRSKEAYDLLYAVGVGTAVGIGSNPTVRGSYDLWRGTTRSNTKALQERWYNRTLRRRFKGDVLVETDNQKQETSSPDSPGYFKPSYSRTKYAVGRSQRGYKQYTKRRGRRCNCKSMLRRVLAKLSCSPVVGFIITLPSVLNTSNLVG